MQGDQVVALTTACRALAEDDRRHRSTRCAQRRYRARARRGWPLAAVVLAAGASARIDSMTGEGHVSLSV